MAFDFSGTVGDAATWTGGTATVPTTDLSAHVDGGQTSVKGTNNAANGDEFVTLYGGAAVVAASVVLLWLFGGVAFRGLPTL